VVALDAGRRQVVCELLGGSRVIRRFRARQILAVERRARATRPRDDEQSERLFDPDAKVAA